MSIICKECDKGFETKAALASHIRCKHKEKNKYICSKCGKELYGSNISILTVHELHCDGSGTKLDKKKNIEPYICSKCGFRIMTSHKQHFISCNGKGPRAKQDHPHANGKLGGWNKGLKTGTNKKLAAKYASGELGGSFKGKKHTAETKRKISESRTKYLLDNPDQVPYVLNHYSKGPSYPEVYWIDLIKNERLDFSYHKRIGLYELDFFNEELMIDLEIDGEQHYVDSNIVESDIRRTEFLEDLGWNVIRVRWSEWKKKSNSEKKNYVDYLHSLFK